MLKAALTARPVPAMAVVLASLAACVYLWANMGDPTTARWMGWPFIYDGLNHAEHVLDQWLLRRTLNCILFVPFFVGMTLALTPAFRLVPRGFLPSPDPATTPLSSVFRWLSTRHYALLPVILAALLGSQIVWLNQMNGWHGTPRLALHLLLLDARILGR